MVELGARRSLSPASKFGVTSSSMLHVIRTSSTRARYNHSSESRRGGQAAEASFKFTSTCAHHEDSMALRVLCQQSPKGLGHHCDDELDN